MATEKKNELEKRSRALAQGLLDGLAADAATQKRVADEAEAQDKRDKEIFDRHQAALKQRDQDIASEIGALAAEVSVAPLTGPVRIAREWRMNDSAVRLVFASSQAGDPQTGEGEKRHLKLEVGSSWTLLAFDTRDALVARLREATFADLVRTVVRESRGQSPAPTIDLEALYDETGGGARDRGAEVTRTTGKTTTRGTAPLLTAKQFADKMNAFQVQTEVARLLPKLKALPEPMRILTLEALYRAHDGQEVRDIVAQTEAML